MGSKVCLGDVADLTPGFAFKSSDFASSSFHVVKIGDIAREIAASNLPTVDLSRYQESKLRKYECRRDDYLIAMTGNTIGKVGRMTAGVAYANQRVLKVSAKLELINPGFLWAIVSSIDLYRHIISHIDSHSAQPNISASSIGQFSFSLPDYDTQQRIGCLLMNIDSHIELSNRTNDYLAA